MTTSIVDQLKGVQASLPSGLWTCLPPLLQKACGYFDQLHEREAFLHGALPVLSRICENVVVPGRDMDHRLAIQVYVTGDSASGKGCADHANALLEVIMKTEEEQRRIAMAKWHAAEPDEDGIKPPEPIKHDMRISLRSTPNTWVREMRKNPEGVVHLLTDSEGDTLKSAGNKEHGNVRSLVKKGWAGEQADFTTKEDGTMHHRVWLSAMICSTQQALIDAMHGDTEDGFSNRYVYHCTPPAQPVHISPFPPPGKKPKSTHRKLFNLGTEVQQIHNRQRNRNPHDPLMVTFTAEQQRKHDTSAQAKLAEAMDEHPHLGGYSKRMHQTVLRTAALFAVLRANPSENASSLVCDDLSFHAACLLRDHWFTTMFEAFLLVTPKAHKTDLRMNVPEDVRKLVCEWRLDGIMPAQAASKLQMRTEPHIRHWLSGLDNPAAAIGKIQRKYLKDLSGNETGRV